MADPIALQDMQPPKAVETDTLIRNRPKAPSLWYNVDGKNLFALPVSSVNVHASFYVSTAVVNLEVKFVNTSSTPLDCLFAIPHKGTVTNVEVQIGETQFMQTALVDKKQVDGLKVKAQPSKASTIPQLNPDEAFVPDLFQLPISGIQAGDTVTVYMDFIEPLQFANGAYFFDLDMDYAPHALPQNATIGQVVTFTAVVANVVPGTSFASDSHTLESTVDEPSGEKYITSKPINGIMDHINITFCVPTEEVLSTCVVQPNVEGTGGSFVTFVTPPPATAITNLFPRNIIFLMDRSGSMLGKPWEEAVRALGHALDTLSDTDAFTIMTFDHKAYPWQQQLVAATVESKKNALQWVAKYPPNRGATDIKGPVVWALRQLAVAYAQSTNTVPFVFLLTDGAVENEREICEYLKTNAGPCRFLTFGVGKFCNWYFLQQVALLGRGFYDACLYPELVAKRVQALMQKAEVPVLQNIALEISGVSFAQVYPFPIPDLFVSAPLLISGTYQGTFPATVILSGRNGEGKYTQQITVMENPEIPVRKVFLKQQLDILTANEWLLQDDDLKQEIVKISIEHNMPSAHTQMIAYEVSEQDFKEGKSEEGKEGKESKEVQLKKDKLRKQRNANALVAAGVVGVVLVGALAVFGGDIAASLSNVPVGELGGLADGIGEGFSEAGDSLGDAAENCDCDCDCDFL